MSTSQQRDLSLQTLAFIHPADFLIFADSSVRDGIEDVGAGLDVLSQDDIVHEWHDPTGTDGSSIQEEKAALKEAIQWLSAISSWASAIIICDCKSLVQAASNANSGVSSVIRLQASAAVLAISKSILIVLAPRHCGLSCSELADHQAKPGAAETQSDNALETATRRALFRRSCCLPPSSTSGWRRCAHLSLVSRSKRPLPILNAPTWLASVVLIALLFSVGSIWWEYPRMPYADCAVRKSNPQNTYAYVVRRFWWNDNIPTLAIRFDELVSLPRAALALLRIIFRRLR